MADQMRCKLLKDEDFDSVEALESDTAQLRQKLDIAISKKQEKQINNLSQILANRERLQEKIAGRTPVDSQDNILACLFDHLFTCLSRIFYLNHSTDV